MKRQYIAVALAACIGIGSAWAGNGVGAGGLNAFPPAAAASGSISPTDVRTSYVQAVTIDAGTVNGNVFNATFVDAGVGVFSGPVYARAASAATQLSIDDGSKAWNFVETGNNLSLNAVADPYQQWDFASGFSYFPYGIRIPSNASVFSAAVGAGVSIGSHGSAITDAPYCTATLDFASALIGACSADLTISCTGCTTAASVSPNYPNAAMVAGSQFNMWVSASGTVSVRHCCQAGSSCDPASSTFGVQCFAH